MRITESDKRTALWMRLEAHIQERLEVYRLQNEGDITQEQTIKLRGKISELKLILALYEPEQASTTDDAELTNSLIRAGFSQE